MGQRSYLTRRFHHITASSKLCSLYFWSAAPLDIFPKNIPDIAEVLKPLEHAINVVLKPAVTDHRVTNLESNLLGLLVHLGGHGFTDPVVTSSSEYEASIKVTNPLVGRIVEQEHQPPHASEIGTLQLSTRKQNWQKRQNWYCEKIPKSQNSDKATSFSSVVVNIASSVQKVSYSKPLHNKSRCLSTMKSFLAFRVISTWIFVYFTMKLWQNFCSALYSPPTTVNITS